MTLDEFGSQVAKMEALAHEYFRLECKYLAYAKPGKSKPCMMSSSARLHDVYRQGRAKSERLYPS